MRKHAGEKVVLLGSDETLDDLVRGGFKVIQHRKGYRFSMDAVLLAHFAQIGRDDRVIELGCGSGVVSILIAARQEGCEITGLEIQPALADRARRSIDMNGLSGRINIINADLRAPEVFLQKRKFTVAVANPPFWKMGEGRVSKNEENLIARHEVKAELKDFIKCASRVLTGSGRLVVINRAGRTAEMLNLCVQEKLYPKRIRFIHPRSGAEANLVLIEAQKGKKSEARILPPLIVYGEDGKYTKEIMDIYFGE